MIHITAKLKPATPADSEPPALVTGVFYSRRAAPDALADGMAHGDPHSYEDVVLPVTWTARTSKRPRSGKTLQTTREASGLVAVVGAS